MKQRKLNKRKGFTLVELLVVIAILAVLATVSVVGYTSFTKKAKVSNDVSLTTQMNTILQANEVTDGKNSTPHEAVEELVAGGLDVTKLTPTANGYSYVYDLDTNRMVLVDEDMNVVSPEKSTFANKLNVFAFVEKESDLEEAKYAGYSFYLKNNFESDDDLTVKTGVDTGNNNISKLTYTNTKATVGQEVMIRTNGGTLEVNAPLDTVEHYAKADKVVITAVAGNSYHENGEISVSLEVSDGHVVVESNANVKEVLVPTNASSTTVVDFKENSTVDNLVVDNASANININERTNINNIVSSNTNINLPSNVSANKIEKTIVSSDIDLLDAVNNDKAYIVLNADISISEILLVKESMTIDGNNHSLSSSANRVIRMTENDIDLTIKNIKAESTYENSDSRCISLDSGLKNLNLTIYNSSIKAGYYAINITGQSGNGSKNVSMQILNSRIEGWAAINNHASSATFLINNSILIGNNDKAYNADGWNNFSTIVFDGGSFYAEGSTSYGSKIIVNNSTIKQITKTGNYQYAFSSQYGNISSEAWFNNVKFEHEGENASFKFNEYDKSNNVKIYIDNELVYEGE